MNRTRTRACGVAATLVALALVMAGCTGGGVKPAFHPTLEWGTCPSDVEIQYFSRHQCGWLTVLQDRSQPEGMTDRLLVVETWPVGEPPLPGFDSGFGGDLASKDGYGSKAAGATRTHHISFTLEPRGTGHSEPSLMCPEVRDLEAREATALTGDSSLLRDFLAAIVDCRDRLASQGVITADYDEENMARDLDDLRAVLGIDRWAFLASYGTNSRILLEYLREFPDRVGGVWMDSPQFPKFDEVSAGIQGTRYALDKLFEACANDASCAKAYPDLRTLWDRALARLERQPLHGSVVVDGGKLLRAVRFVLGGDGPENLTTLPSMIAAAARGRLDPQLQDIAGNLPLFCSGYRPLCTGIGAEGFSLGVYLTVLCRDEAPFIDRGALARQAAGDRAYEAVFVHDPYLAACDEWNVPPADPAVHAAVSTHLPLLIVSGQFDSFSPTPMARSATKTSSNAWVLEIPGQTHNALGFSECPISIRNEWIKDPMSAPSGTGCLKDMGIVFATRGA